MTRWMHPPELERQRDRDQFDPVVEGDRYGLSRDVSLAIWERVCADATDGFGRRDTKQAEQRFHEIAARIAARGGRLRPDVGRLTRVAIESDGTPRGAWSIPELAPRIPGRETLVAVEARRWKAMGAEPAAVLEETEAAAGSERDGGATERHELPHANDVAQSLTSLLRPPSSSDPANASDLSERAAARRRLDIDLAAWSPPGREIDREPRDGQLPAATLARMEQAYGQRFDDVEIHADSAEVSAGQQAFTRGRHIYFERGAFEPESDHGEHVIAHELAHVAQQSQPAGDGRRPASRVALEADADQAALSALAGRAAIVNLFAPPSAALGFSNGKPPQHPASAHGSAGRPPAQSARGSTPASSSGATHAPAGGRAPTSAGSGGASARSGATPAARPAASYAAASTPPAAAPHRGANADGLLVPEAPSTLTPGAAARLQTIHTNNQGVATATTTLPSGEQQTSVARDAVVEPQAEQDAHAQHGVVAAVDDRPPPSPEIEAACARIRQVIRDKRPPDEDKLVDAKPREMAQEAGNQMSAGVEQRAGTVRQGYADMQNSPQGTPSRTPVPATLPPERVSTPPVDAAAGAPDPLHHDDVSLDNDVSAQKQRIDDAGMNTEPAKLVKDGPIGDAHGGADDLQEMAKTDPQKVIADQAAAIAKAKGDMRALQESGEKALADARAGAVSQMATHTTGVKGSEEQQRAQAGEQMKAVFTRTQKSVDTLLQPLSADAVARWDAGVAQLSTDFEASLADVKRRIDERHSGVGGMFAAGWDWATGLPDWVTEGYDRAEAKFGDGATNLIRDISRDVNKVIEDCKKLIELARKEIEAIVKSLPASLQTWAQGEAAKLNQQLDALDKRVDQTQKGINQDLINHANGAVQQVRERVHDLREKAKGALAKIAAAIVEFAKNPAKAIVDGLLHILGIPPASFWSMIDRLGDVVGAIAKDPVKFGKTLISGAAQGFKQFFEHFPTHLKEILMGWLFGTMGTAGVPMPTDFSGPGIMVTVLGIVGIDTSMISSMLGADVSDPAEMAEVRQELAGVLSGDPHALVNLFREHFDPASLIPMIKEAAMSFLLQALITQVAPRIAAMLVPGGAILQAVEAIFKVLMWVINNAARIFTLIESLVATAGQAVAGNVSGVAAGVESGLVQIIVLVIDFLASYLGLGGLGAKLKGVIMKLSGKLKGVLKKVLDAIKKRAKAKAKHDHHKPADKKPDADHAGPTHPKQDDRDPQKAKDDAKDPRNHQRDPEDKDPRNHKHDDDKDPRNPKHDDDKDPRSHKHDDDRDPKKHNPDEDHDPRKPKDDDDPKKKHENDLAEARRVARAAANRGWTAARTATEREVLARAELKSVLSRAEHSTPQIHISLEIQNKGTSWGVEAEAKVGSAKARDTEGNGWIAFGDGSQPWYAARDLRAFNHKLIEGVFHQLAAPAPANAADRTDDDHYRAKVEQARDLAPKGQSQLDAQIRGLEFSIHLAPYQASKESHKISTVFKVAPNKTEETHEVGYLGEKASTKWAEQIAEAAPKAQPVITNALDEKSAEYVEMASWPEVVNKLRKHPKVEPLVEKPLLRSHPFGVEAHDTQAVPAVRDALAEIAGDGGDGTRSPDDVVNSYKSQLHEAKSPFLASRSELAKQVFEAANERHTTETMKHEFKAKLEAVKEEEHKKFKPLDLEEIKAGDQVIAIRYRTEVGSVFKARFDPGTGLVTSIVGANLVLKAPGNPRGYTGNPLTKTPNQGQDSSHLIGDRFGGSGYAASENLIAASSKYNQIDMKAVEDDINEWIVANGIAEFTMKVTVTWGGIDGPEAIDAIVRANPQYQQAEMKQQLKNDLRVFIAANHGKLKRCMSTNYLIISKEPRGLSETFPLGPDVHLGVTASAPPEAS